MTTHLRKIGWFVVYRLWRYLKLHATHLKGLFSQIQRPWKFHSMLQVHTILPFELCGAVQHFQVISLLCVVLVYVCFLQLITLIIRKAPFSVLKCFHVHSNASAHKQQKFKSLVRNLKGQRKPSG